MIRGSRDLTAEGVDDDCHGSAELAGFERPRRIVFVDALPTNPSGKVLERELAALMDSGAS